MKPINKNIIQKFTRFVIIIGVLFVFSCKTSPEKKTQVLANKVEQKAEDVVFGDDAASKTVFLYASYNCDYCRYFFSRTYPELKTNFLNKEKFKLVVKWVDFSENPQILYALQAASCIGRFGVYEKYHQLLLVNPSVVFTEDFAQLIDDIMQDNSEIAECILNNNNYEYIRSNIKEFHENKLTGTPTFILNNHAYSGFISYENFKKILKKEFNL